MKKELALKWIEALESGKYKKGSGEFRSNCDCFCAVGVLMDVVDPSKWGPGPVSPDHDSYWEGAAALMHSRHFLVLGLASQESSLIGEVMGISDRNETFEPVVKYIRTYYENI